MQKVQLDDSESEGEGKHFKVIHHLFPRSNWIWCSLPCLLYPSWELQESTANKSICSFLPWYQRNRSSHRIPVAHDLSILLFNSRINQVAGHLGASLGSGYLLKPRIIFTYVKAADKATPTEVNGNLTITSSIHQVSSIIF